MDEAATVWAAVVAVCGVIITVVPMWYKVNWDLKTVRAEIERKAAQKHKEMTVQLGESRRAEKACRTRVRSLVKRSIQNRLLIEELTTKCSTLETEVDRLSKIISGHSFRKFGEAASED